MDIIERLRDDAMWIDAIDDAIEEIERLRRELADAKRPPNVALPFAARAEHKRTVPTIICGNCGRKFPFSGTTYCPGCGIEEMYGEEADDD